MRRHAPVESSRSHDSIYGCEESLPAFRATNLLQVSCPHQTKLILLFNAPGSIDCAVLRSLPFTIEVSPQLHRRASSIGAASD